MGNHKDLTDPEIHECKGFAAADNSTRPRKSSAGVLEWVADDGTDTGGGVALPTFSSSTGLTAYFTQGYIQVGANSYLLSGSSVVLTDASTNYVAYDPTTQGLVSNTTGFTPSTVALAVIDTAAGVVVSSGTVGGLTLLSMGYISVAITGNTTLTNLQASADTIKMTGTPGAFNLVVPNKQPPTWYVNATDGICTVKTSAGTGIAVAVGKTACVRADGTNCIRLTADV